MSNAPGQDGFQTDESNVKRCVPWLTCLILPKESKQRPGKSSINQLWLDLVV